MSTRLSCARLVLVACTLLALLPSMVVASDNDIAPCPPLVERLMAKARHAHCFTDTAMEGSPVYASAAIIPAAFCDRAPCRAAIEEVLSIPFDNACLLIGSTVIRRTELEDALDACPSTTDTARRLRDGHVNHRTRALGDNDNGYSVSSVGMIVGFIVLLLLLCACLSFCPRRQDTNMSGKTWLCCCLALPAPVFLS